MSVERALDFVLQHEGGYSDDPRDPGGATNYGISLRFALGLGDLDKDGRPDLDIDGDGDIDPDDIRQLTKDKASDIYRQAFWGLLKCDAMPPRVALLVFDAGVNQGRGPAITMLQAVLGVAQDGRLGTQTLGALNIADPERVCVDYSTERILRYARTRDPRTGTHMFDSYGRGWARRVLWALVKALE